MVQLGGNNVLQIPILFYFYHLFLVIYDDKYTSYKITTHFHIMKKCEILYCYLLLQIPQSNEGKHWFWYVDRTVTSELLQQLTAEFLHIFDKCPSRLKRKIMSISANQSPSINHPSLPNSPFVSISIQ